MNLQPPNGSSHRRNAAPAGGRVRRSHQFTRSALISSLGFGVAAATWAIVIIVRGGSWWGPLHTFLAGTVLLAISGTSQMFTVTWATTSPPSWWATTSQRWLLAGGVIAVLVGVPRHVDFLVWIGAATVAVSLLVLAGSINAAVRRSLLRRFDLASRFYLVAFAAGIVGVFLGASIATGTSGSWFVRIRLVHSHLNLMALVGLTIIGTIPTFLATTAHHRAVSGREARTGWFIGVAGAVSIVLGLWWPRLVGVGTIAIAASGTIILVGIVTRLWDQGRNRLAFLQVASGVTWLIAWATVDGIRIVTGTPATAFASSVGTVVVGGVGQVLLGAFGYLLPVLKGSPFTRSRHIMQQHPAVPLAAANLAAVSFAASLTSLAFVATGVWVVDFTIRVIRMTTGTEQDASADIGPSTAGG